MQAQVNMQNFNKTFLYHNIEMITLSIKYPCILLYNNPNAQWHINNQIMIEVNEFYNYVVNQLYNQAVQSYIYATENNFPFHGFQAIMEYTITYNDNCFLSYYNDKYEYTGGAHGMTIRSSNTFDLRTGTKIPLYCYFKKGTDYKGLLTKEIIKQVNNQLQENPGIYFNNYAELIVTNFSEDNYFLTPEGLSIYFQHYDIAPYSTGIVVFTIPYETIGYSPSC